jgi:hypothetical protein
MICVSKVVKFDIYPCDYLDSNPGNDIIVPCLNDFERVVRRINAYVPDRYIVRIWVPVEVFGVCVCRYGSISRTSLARDGGRPRRGGFVTVT